MANRFKEFQVNTLGKDYFVGDLHGCYTKFMEALDEVGFNFKVDRVFCVGDLIDRGQENVQCLELLDETWFNSVYGNHEDLAYHSIESGEMDYVWVSNGGDWYNDLMITKPTEVIKRIDRRILSFRNLPIVIKVGDIGVAHAEYFGHFDDLKNDTILRSQSERLIWGRKRINRELCFPVEGIKALVVGHTPVNEITKFGNTVYIDHGAVFYHGRKIKLYSTEEILNFVENTTKPSI